MLKLLIDTHGPKATVVLYDDNHILKVSENTSYQGHSNIIMPLIDNLLKEYKTIPKDIKEIYVINGPGSFTGTRIGVTIAKTMAYTLNIPIKTISSLLIKALSSSLIGTKLVVESDKNGYFLGLFNENNQLINDYFYLNNMEFQNYISENNHEDNYINEIDIDYNKINEYLNTIKSENPHSVKPLYIKKIEVLND